jgi:hypothetical protein
MIINPVIELELLQGVPNKAELLGLEKIIASNKTLFAINKLNIK